LCVGTPPPQIFNKPTDVDLSLFKFPDFFYFDITEWVSESTMTEEEKIKNPGYKVTEGFLRINPYKDTWQKAWDRAPISDKAKVFDLPNFDAEIFFEISGIDLRGKSPKNLWYPNGRG
jgi:hypothetical protein